jgi:hypothetical protein
MQMTPFARPIIVGVCIVLVVAAAVGGKNLTARPIVHFTSIESHCRDSWPDNFAVARVFRAEFNMGVGAISLTPEQWIGPSGGVIATFSPLPVTVLGRYGPVTPFEANGEAIHTNAEGSARIIVLRIRDSNVTSKFHRWWPDYRWFEFWSSDTEPVCTWLPV